MARPPRHNAEFFYHPASLRNDRRVKAIRARLGLAGYGLLLMLLEVLTDADHTQLETDEIELELLAGDLGVSVAEIEGLLGLAEKVGLFARNAAGRLHCPQLDEWLAPVFEKRNRTRNTPKPPAAGVPVTETPVTVAEIHTIEESTVQNSREDSTESSSAEHKPKAGAQKKNEGAGFAVPTQPSAPRPPVAAPPHSPAARRAGTYRDYDEPWPEQLHPPFETPAFHAAWAKWGKYLAERRKPHSGLISEEEDLLKLRRLAENDHQKALDIISESISTGWKSLNIPTHAAHPHHPAGVGYPARPTNGHKPAGNGGALARALAEQRLAG